MVEDGGAHHHGVALGSGEVALVEPRRTARTAEALVAIDGAVTGKLIATVANDGDDVGGVVARVDVHHYGLDLGAAIAGLAGAGVSWVLGGSLAATVWGVAERPRDLDVIPSLEPENLERLASLLERWRAYPLPTPSWPKAPSLAEIAAWTPRPATAANLDHLLATSIGLIDVVPGVAGSFESLVSTAVDVSAFGARVRVATPDALRATLRPSARPRHARRDVALATATDPFHLISARLGMRRWRSDDDILAARLWGDPRVTRYIESAPLSARQIAARLDREIEQETRTGLSYWPLFCRERAALVGCCGLRPGPDPDTPEIGVHLAPDEWGRGYAREAMSAVIEHAFADLGVSALFAGHHPDNAASRRMLESLGFTGTGEQLYEPTGRMHPTYRISRP